MSYFAQTTVTLPTAFNYFKLQEENRGRVHRVAR